MLPTLLVLTCGGGPPPKAGGGVIVLELPGLGEPRVDLSRAGALRVRMLLRGADATPAQARIRSSNGREISPARVQRVGDAVLVDIPAAQLAPDEYEIFVRRGLPEPAVFSFFVTGDR